MGLLDNLSNFAQGASNSAASNLTAPVDGLAWLLRKAGLPIPNAPIGGSDWAAQNGFTRPATGNAGLLGEAVGGVAPMLAAAKAPQIARGLLQGAENLAAPATMNSQTGAIVWHGSPHKFDKFDASKIGTGEGAQAYGHGLYVAESPDVAKSYIEPNAFRAFDIAPEAEKRGMNLSAGARGEMIRQAASNSDPMIAARRLQYANSSTREIPQEKLAELISAYKEAQTGALYKIDLPDEHIAKMLDWDKPLSQQHPDVQKAIFVDVDSAIGNTKNALIGASERRAPVTQAELDRLMRERTRLSNLSGGDYYKQQSLGTTSGQPSAADSLKELGIPGIRYLDGGSRGTGTGSSNFVVFPGNEGLLNIMERNGQPIGGLLK